MEQELPIPPEHLSPPTAFMRFRVAQSLVSNVMFCRSLFVLLLFVVFWSLFRLSIADSFDYPIGTFKHFLLNIRNTSKIR